MSDSLREQLLKAGFTETERPKQRTRKSGQTKQSRQGAKQQGGSGPGGSNPGGAKHKPRHKKTGKSHSGKAQAAKASPARGGGSKNTPSAEELAAIAKRKEIKAGIKALIDTHAIKDVKGEIGYSYMLGKRVKQIFVNEKVHEKLASEALVITRLNGNTEIIPPDIVEQILALNPDWAIVRNGEAPEVPEQEDDYAGYEIPDDLRW